MESMYLGISVVFPLISYMGLGRFIRYKGWASEQTFSELNKITFRILMALLIFMNTYAVDIKHTFSDNNVKVLWIGILSVLICFTVSGIVCGRIIADEKKRVIVVQGIYRSNVALFGLPVSMTIYGEGNLSAISLLIAVIVPFYNIVSVLLLIRAGKQKLSLWQTVTGVFKNPLVIGAAAGIFCSLVQVRLPVLLLTPLETLAKSATPLAFIVLGGSMAVKHMKAHKKEIISITLLRLVVIPTIIVGTAVTAGVRNHELVAILGLAASPVAVTSYSMAKEMEIEAELAGELVAATAIASSITLFCWVTLLKSMQLI